ncbi:MAG TPA: ATP-binding protein [Thermoanaerobaculia bacterium]|jgi:CheY-like chemotaxis protein
MSLADETSLDRKAHQKAEKRAVEAEKMGEIGRHTFEIMHRLSNDLGLVPTSIRKIKRVLDEIGLRQPRIDGELDRILDDVQGVLRFAKELMKVLSLPTQRQPEDCFIGTLIEEIVANLRIEDKAVELDLRVKDTAGSIRGDSQQISDALLNLLNNAIEGMPEGGRLTVEADGDDSMVTIRISDTGQGIQASHLKRIFDLGYTTKSGGSGFGLWSVKRTVMSHGGEIDLASEPGAGTTFAIRLPRATKANQAPTTRSHHEVSEPIRNPTADLSPERSKKMPPEQSSDNDTETDMGPNARLATSSQVRPRRILIVEDLPVWRKAIGESLQGAEFEIETAASRREAEEKLARGTYDLCILDLRLEDADPADIDGMEILRNLPTDQKRPKVIVLSAYATRDVMREGFSKHGVSDFISKQDFEDIDLRDEVRRLLDEGLAENRDLEILWDGLSAMEAVAVLRLGGVPLADADKEAVASELETLLRRLFNRADIIHVKRLHPGWSGAGVLRVEPFSEAHGQPRIVKFGDSQQIDRERENFLKVAKPYLGSRAMVEEYRKSGRLGGLVYSRVGANSRDAGSRGPRPGRRTSPRGRPARAGDAPGRWSG